MRESIFLHYATQFTSSSKSVLVDFHNTFLYGYDAKIMHKGKPKQMSLYLDNYKDNLLWVSSKSKGSVIDLYFTTIQHRKISQIECLRTKWHYFTVTQFSDEFTIVFEDESEKQTIFNLFKVYTESLKVKDPHYCSYFSTIYKKQAISMAKTGKNCISEKDVQNISLELGLHNKEQNKAVLDECLKISGGGQVNAKMISIECIDNYFKIQFCSRKLQPIFQKYAHGKLGEIEKNPKRTLEKIMSLREFEFFLRNSQREREEKINEILQAQQGDLSFFDFCLFLYDEVYCSVHCSQETDESYPLNYYFCYSSHNTYLSGNQLTSDCKVQRYEEDLDTGIKCVELDIHNDGNKPIVTHAIADRGFCEPILFEDVIKEIDRYSEKCKLEGIGHYPIILSLENHASETNKENILNILTKYCGDTLYMLDVESQNFPSLSELKGRIIVKTSSKYSERINLAKGQGNSEYNTVSMNHLDHCLMQMSSNYPSFVTRSLQDSYQNFSHKKARMQHLKNDFDYKIRGYSKFLYPISSMSKITSIFKAQEGIKTVDSTAFQCTSLTNIKVLKKDLNEIIAYSKRSWLRTYPIGTEFNSDNYNPSPMFKAGAQIIALNTQKKDDYAWMTNAYFCGGRFGLSSVCGYVLKPRHLLPGFEGGSSLVRHEVTVRIIESQGYKIGIRLVGDIQDMKNNEKSIEQFIVTFLDEGFLIFDISEVYKACLALRFLAEGYRVIEVKSQNSFLDTGGRIIVHVTIKRV